MTPQIKANILTAILVISLIIGLITFRANWSVALPAAIFYLLLVFNTYFSVKFFATIIPETKMQRLIDTILVILYILVAFHVNNPVYFLVLLSIFFALATIKYIQLLGTLPQPKLLKRKIMADCLGTVLVLLVLFGVLAGYPVASLWALAVIFAIANVWVLQIDPLYRVDA